MKLTVRGVPGQPIALLIHPMLGNERFFDDLLDELHGKYRVAIPVLDGHYPDAPDFLSARQEAEVLQRKLAAEGVDRIRIMLACSLGAAVGLEFLSLVPRGMVQLSVFDSATLMDSGLSHATCLHDLRRLHKVTTTHPEKARRHIDVRNEDYAYVISHTARTLGPATMMGIANASCRATLPQIPESAQPFMTFTWGSFDPAMKSLKRIQAAYPRARIEIKDRYGHCDYLLMHPEEYASEFLS